MDSYLSNLLDTFSTFSLAEKRKVNNYFTEKVFPAKHELVSFQTRTDSLYLIKKGCIRKYCYKDGTPWTLQIATEAQFAVEYVSFITGGKSKNILETVEECTVLEIRKADLEALYVDVPKMNEVMRKVLQEVIYRVHVLLNDFIVLSPEERYLKLLKINPALTQRISQHILASYLGISATSLSRIRKRIAEKK